MQQINGHVTSRYSEEAAKDALFHYTTATGLLGIIENKGLWSTAHYAANDESELSFGEKVLSAIFSEEYYSIEKKSPEIIDDIRKNGVQPSSCIQDFAKLLPSLTLSSLSTFFTCFCRCKNEEDFQHGLLSQWRGYGKDGGYALQFSRKRLQQAIRNSNYDLENVRYSDDNDLKDLLLQHSNAFSECFENHLKERGEQGLSLLNTKPSNPLKGLSEGPLEALLNYIVYTKNKHFSEENETRMSLIQPRTSHDSNLPIKFYNRNGLVVPYVQTPEKFDILSCVDWIIVGPSPRINARCKAVSQLIANSGYDIKIRPSHIPFTRQ